MILKRQNYLHYIHLMRLHKPIGIFLLLWPTLWALWLAKRGMPDLKLIVIFITGVILMRSAGCIINDIWDRNYDGHVDRTRDRPLASGQVTVQEAMILALILVLSAFVLVLFCNHLTIFLSLLAAVFTLCYPLLKRYIPLPQLGLGVAFSWGIPMAFAATQETVPFSAWILFMTAMLWPVIYDTMYAMVDKEDDLKIGVKSSAILFAHGDKWIIGGLQFVFILMMFLIGFLFSLTMSYFLSIGAASFLFLYQQWLIRHREREQCFLAFLNNQWVGFIIFVGLLMSTI